MTIYTYSDQEKYVYEEDGFLFVDKSGEVASYDADDQSYAVWLFLGKNTYEENVGEWPLGWYEYNPIEKVTKISEEDGMLYIETEAADEAFTTEYEDDGDYTSDDVIYVRK